MKINLQPQILRRFAAFGIDWCVLSIYIALMSGAFALLPRTLIARWFATPMSGQATVLIILTIPVLLYFALQEQSRYQATVGKRCLGMRVTSVDGQRITLLQSLLRSGLKLVPWELSHTCLWRIEGWPQPTAAPQGWPLVGLVVVWVLVGAYFLSMLLTPRRQTLYDLAAGSVVQSCATREEQP